MNIQKNLDFKREHNTLSFILAQNISAHELL
nr:MAG TPA: hypothetical protein [Caudoviricetes sp.]DAW67826.1 MAG TPA: hypothetical protein [Bacteriophage sp.]